MKIINLTINSELIISLKLTMKEYSILCKHPKTTLIKFFSTKNTKSIYILKRMMKKYITDPVDREKIYNILKTAIIIKKDTNNNEHPTIIYSEDRLLKKLRQTISRFKIMNKNEEQECINSLFDETRQNLSKKDGIQKLVLTNLRMNWEIVNKYKNRGVNMLDLFLSSIPGSIKALKRYKKNKNSKPQTYMFWWIMQTSGREIYDNSRLIREPVHREELLNKISIFRRNYFNNNGVLPTNDLIAQHINISVKKIKRILSINKNIFSLDKKINKLDGNSLHELLIDKDQMSNPREYIKLEEKINFIKKCIQSLDPKQQTVMNMKFGLGNKQTKHSINEIVNQVKLSKEQVRVIISNTIKLIEKKIKKEYKNMF